MQVYFIHGGKFVKRDLSLLPKTIDFLDKNGYERYKFKTIPRGHMIMAKSRKEATDINLQFFK